MSMKEPIVYSNFLFFVNALLYGVLGFPTLMVLFSFSAFFSLQYHRYPKSDILHQLDRIFAVLALLVVLSTSFMTLSLLNFGILFSIALSTLLVKRYGDIQTDEVYYKQCHTGWHLAVFFANMVAAIILYRF